MILHWHMVRFVDDLEPPHSMPTSWGADFWPSLRGQRIAVRIATNLSVTDREGFRVESCDCEQFFDVEHEMLETLIGQPIPEEMQCCRRMLEMD